MVKGRILMILALSALALMLTSCGKNDQDQTDTSSNGPVPTIPKIEESLVTNQVPENFPESIPLPEGLSSDKLFHDAKTNDGNTVVFASEMPVTDLYNYYTKALGEAGWTVTQSKQHNADNAFVNFQKGEQLCNIYITVTMPEIYPEKLGLQGSFVRIMYNLKPQPDLF